jgi:hypothetical protein
VQFAGRYYWVTSISRPVFGRHRGYLLVESQEGMGWECTGTTGESS